MAVPLRTTFAAMCRDTRTMLDISQSDLAAAAGVSRGHIAAIEIGRVNPSLDLVERIGRVLGLDFALISRPIIAIEPPRQRDSVHAWCSGYVHRRLSVGGWLVQREVSVVQDRRHGWIDLLAYDPATRILIIVEIKTEIDDLGAVERQLGWYEQMAALTSRRFAWSPTRTVGWLLLLATDAIDEAIRINRDALAMAFPDRATTLRRALDDAELPALAPRGLALVDPARRRRDWLIPARIDGRRSGAPYRDYADAARRHRLLGAERVLRT